MARRRVQVLVAVIVALWVASGALAGTKTSGALAGTKTSGALAGTKTSGALAPTGSCSHVVVFTLPGITWEHIARVEPPAIDGAVDMGAVGSMSVRTNSARTSYSSGFATIGAGARLDGTSTAGGLAASSPIPEAGRDKGFVARDVVAAGVDEMQELARAAGYRAAPGALGSALGDIPLAAVGNGDPGKPPPLPAGFGRWSLVAAMDRLGTVDLSATGGALLRPAPGAPYGVRSDPGAMRSAVDRILSEPCSSMIVDQGDLGRADMAAVADGDVARSERRIQRALLAADDLVARVKSALDFDRDLLLILSPTSPADANEAHLGSAIAIGPGFPAGAVLESASTRRRGIVTLPDVAPTLLDHLGAPIPASMNGRPWFATDAGTESRIEAAVDLDRESVFVDGLKSDIATAFIVFQVLVYLAGTPFLARRERLGPGAPLRSHLPARRSASRHGRRVDLHRWPEPAALAAVAFPVSTYLAGVAKAHELGALGYIALLISIDLVLLIAIASLIRTPLERLLALTALTTMVLVADLVTGSRLQLNTAFGYSPIVAGRFSGAGNITFAVLGASGLITGALITHGWARKRAALVVVAALFFVVVVVDGAPQFGSDVGGTLALVPALGITWMLLAGHRPTARTLLLSAAAGLLVLGVFLAVDLARPPESRTHLARLWQDVGERGVPVLVDTIERKAEANVRVFGSTVYTLFVPPALGVMAWLLRRPRGRWERLARVYPRLRAGLIGGLILAVLGFAVNDSGIVIPAVVLSYLVPMALLVHLALEQENTA
ncbi:membrane protein [soil metagenome]